MINPVKAILFATDLTQDCQQALEFTIAMGTRFNAMIYMLHVIEKLPANVQNRLENVLGRHRWEDLVNQQQTFAHKSLLGKQAADMGIRKQVHEFCLKAGIDNGSCDFQSREIIITDGDIVESILFNAKDNECDMIVLGAKKSFLSGNSIGSKIKSVLKDARIPVTVVPTIQNEE